MASGEKDVPARSSKDALQTMPVVRRVGLTLRSPCGSYSRYHTAPHTLVVPCLDKEKDGDGMAGAATKDVWKTQKESR